VADDISISINAWNADGEPFTPEQVDDIVTQLRAAHPLQYGDLNGRLVENAECNDDPQIRDRVNRCWKCEQWSPCDVRRAADEIEQLRGDLLMKNRRIGELADHIEELQEEINDLRLQVVALSIPKEARRG